MNKRRRTTNPRAEGPFSRTIQHVRYTRGMYNPVLRHLRDILDKAKVPHAIPNPLPREGAPAGKRRLKAEPGPLVPTDARKED